MTARHNHALMKLHIKIRPNATDFCKIYDTIYNKINWKDVVGDIVGKIA